MLLLTHPGFCLLLPAGLIIQVYSVSLQNRTPELVLPSELDSKQAQSKDYERQETQQRAIYIGAVSDGSCKHETEAEK